MYISVLFKKYVTYLIWEDKIMFHATLRSFDLHKVLNPNAFVDGVINGVSLHIEPPRI